MDETQQETLGNQEEKTRPQYRYICSNTAVGFLNLLNDNYKEGYKLFGDVELGDTIVDAVTHERFQMRQAYLYDSETSGLNSDEKSKRMQIIDAIDKAETHLYDRKTSLEGRENFLLLETNWDKVNAQRKIDDLSKISNEKQRTAHLNNDKDLKLLKQEVQEAEQWLKLVKKYAELHELPSGKAPWEKEETGEVYEQAIGAEAMVGDTNG